MGRVFQISEAVSLAFHSMLLIAVKDELLSVKNIAEETGVSQNHLSKVLQRLVKEGLVASTRGPRGGFRLARLAEDITLLDVYEAMEGPLEAGRCLLGRKECLVRKCIMMGILEEMTDQFRKHLSNRTLSDIVSEI